MTMSSIAQKWVVLSGHVLDIIINHGSCLGLLSYARHSRGTFRFAAVHNLGSLFYTAMFGDSDLFVYSGVLIPKVGSRGSTLTVCPLERDHIL